MISEITLSRQAILYRTLGSFPCSYTKKLFSVQGVYLFLILDQILFAKDKKYDTIKNDILAFIKVVNKMQQEENQTAMYHLRRKNKNRIFRLIYSEREISRQEIATTLSLSLPTVNQNLKELYAQGLIEFAGTFSSTGGRRPTIIALAYKAFTAIGIEISSSAIRFIALDLLGQRIGSSRVIRRFTDTDSYFETLSTSLETFLTQNGVERSRIIGVGISLPGIISLDSKTLEMAPSLGISQFPLSRFTDAIPYPCLFDNDASAGGFAEQFGRDDKKTMAYFSIGKGIGGACFIDGEPYEGTHRRSAEFGHLCIHPEDGMACACGHHGCLEAYCSTDRISSDFSITIEEFFGRVENGDEACVSRLDTYLSDLAIGIASVHTILDCDVIIGGQIVSVLEPYLEQLKEKVNERILPQADPSFLSLSKLHSLTNCTGAALRWIQKVLEET